MLPNGTRADALDARAVVTLVISRENLHDDDRLRITWLVPRASVDAAVRALHAELRRGQ